MIFFDKLKSSMPKQKSKEKLEERFYTIELEKGDLPAMLIAAIITFGPVILIISLAYVGIAFLFGL